MPESQLAVPEWVGKWRLGVQFRMCVKGTLLGDQINPTDRTTGSYRSVQHKRGHHDFHSSGSFGKCSGDLSTLRSASTLLRARIGGGGVGGNTNWAGWSGVEWTSGATLLQPSLLLFALHFPRAPPPTKALEKRGRERESGRGGEGGTKAINSRGENQSADLWGGFAA